MNSLYVAYQVLMAILALAIVWLVTLPEEPWIYQANVAIWALFVVDYLVRMAVSTNRRLFVRRNLLDLIAVVPFDYLLEMLLSLDLFGLGRLARLARVVRLIRVARAGAVLWRASHNVREIIRTNGLGYVLLVTCSLVLLGGVSLWLAEPDIGTVEDGIWWSLVTATTVGYGDISPKTPIGRLVAGVLMLIGIGTISMITGTIATYFMGRGKSADPHIQHIVAELERWDELSPEQRTHLADLLALMAKKPRT